MIDLEVSLKSSELWIIKMYGIVYYENLRYPKHTNNELSYEGPELGL